LTLRAESSFTNQSRLPQSKRGEWKAFELAFGKGLLKQTSATDTKMLTESPEEIFLRFERPKTVWFELAYVKSSKRFRAFRCNAFEQDPDWQLISAATLPEAKRAILNWLKRNKDFSGKSRLHPLSGQFNSQRFICLLELPFCNGGSRASCIFHTSLSAINYVFPTHR
jgi:hypothetical protein